MPFNVPQSLQFVVKRFHCLHVGSNILYLTFTQSKEKYTTRSERVQYKQTKKSTKQ